MEEADFKVLKNVCSSLFSRRKVYGVELNDLVSLAWLSSREKIENCTLRGEDRIKWMTTVIQRGVTDLLRQERYIQQKGRDHAWSNSKLQSEIPEQVFEKPTGDVGLLETEMLETLDFLCKGMSRTDQNIALLLFACDFTFLEVADRLEMSRDEVDTRFATYVLPAIKRNSEKYNKLEKKTNGQALEIDLRKYKRFRC